MGVNCWHIELHCRTSLHDAPQSWHAPETLSKVQEPNLSNAKPEKFQEATFFFLNDRSIYLLEKILLSLFSCPFPNFSEKKVTKNPFNCKCIYGKKLLYLAKTLIVHRYQNNVRPKQNKIFLSTHINQIYRICSGFKTS